MLFRGQEDLELWTIHETECYNWGLWAVQVGTWKTAVLRAKMEAQLKLGYR